jgi:thioredoxin reductase (NADPH)
MNPTLDARAFPTLDPDEMDLLRSLAGGDVRAGSTKRVGFAVGDGSFAVTCVHKLRTIRA